MMKYLFFITINIWVFSTFGQTLNWVSTYGGQGYDEGFSATQLADSSYIVVGSTSSFYNSNQNILFLHVDSSGTFLNSTFINNGGYERANNIIPLNNNQFWLAGFTNSMGYGGFDGYLVKTDLQGNKIEDFTFGGSDWDFINDFIMLSDSSLILVGETNSYGNGNKDAYILRVDKLGDTLWTRTMGDTKDDWANAVVLYNDTLLIVGGTEDADSDTTFGLYIALSLNGDSLFQQQIGTSNFQYFNDIINYPFSNAFYLTGTSMVAGDKLLYFHFTNPQAANLGENIWGNAGGDSEIFASANYPGTSQHVHAVTSNAPGSSNFYPSTDIIAQKTSPGGFWSGGQIYGHNFEDDANVDVEECRTVLDNFENVEVMDNLEEGIYPMPILSTDTDITLVGRIRKDIYANNIIHFFNAADQVRVGAATNSIRIALKWIEMEKDL